MDERRATSADAHLPVTRGAETTSVDGWSPTKRTGRGSSSKVINRKVADSNVSDSNDVATRHSHPEPNTISGPSFVNVAAAKSAHQVFLISTAGGLYSVDPGGAVAQVFKNPAWATAKN